MLKPDFIKDPEDDIILESRQEIDDLIESYKTAGLDSYREAYDYDNYDVDNYGYDY